MLCKQENNVVDLNVHRRKDALETSESGRSKLQSNALSRVPFVLFKGIDWNCSRSIWKWRHALGVGIGNYSQHFIWGAVGGKVFGDF